MGASGQYDQDCYVVDGLGAGTGAIGATAVHFPTGGRNGTVLIGAGDYGQGVRTGSADRDDGGFRQ